MRAMPTYDPTDIAAQEQEQERQQALLTHARRVELDDLRWMIAHKQGRRILWRLLERTGLYRSSFNTNGMTMAMNEGQRNLGLFLLAELMDAAPDAYAQMLKEHKQ